MGQSTTELLSLSIEVLPSLKNLVDVLKDIKELQLLENLGPIVVFVR